MVWHVISKSIEKNEFVVGFPDLAKPARQCHFTAHWFTNGEKCTDLKEILIILVVFSNNFVESTQRKPRISYFENKLLLTEVVLDDHCAWSVIKHLYPESSEPLI
jgi:hypothetical protein